VSSAPTGHILYATLLLAKFPLDMLLPAKLPRLATTGSANASNARCDCVTVGHATTGNAAGHVTTGCATAGHATAGCAIAGGAAAGHATTGHTAAGQATVGPCYCGPCYCGLRFCWLRYCWPHHFWLRFVKKGVQARRPGKVPSLKGCSEAGTHQLRCTLSHRTCGGCR